MLHLLKNGAEALGGRDGGRVILRGARDDHGKVLIQVIDNGPGIEAEHLEDIFLPFFTTKRSGSGVGLSVSRQIMALNKGLLTVKTTPGTGSEFTLGSVTVVVSLPSARELRLQFVRKAVARGLGRLVFAQQRKCIA